MNLELAWPWMLAVLPLPLLVAWRLPAASRPLAVAIRVPFFDVFAGAPEHTGVPANRLRLLLATGAWILLVLAAARPQWIGQPLQMPVFGRDIMMAVDISGSMQATDMVVQGRRADRLTTVKIVAGDFIKRRQGDRLGLILFGGQAYLQAPMTFDRHTVATLLQESAIGLAGKQTALGDAIGLAVKRLRKQAVGNRLVVLLTDGANTAGNIDPLKAAQLAAGEQIRIYTIGIGTPSNGNPLTAGDLDEQTLAEIAETTGGRYFRARDSAALQNIYEILDQLEPLSEDSMTMRPVVEVYWWPLAAAVALTMLMALLAVRLPKSLPQPETPHDL